MDKKTLLNRMEEFDPILYGLYAEERQRQHYSLSLLPTANGVSPFVAYLKGGILGNSYLDHTAAEHCGELEHLAASRAREIFGSEHAIVRVGNIGAASRVVFHCLAKNGDRILSFNLRKSEHCAGENLSFDFVNYSIEPDSQIIDLDHVEKIARECRPKIIIFSPVNYPRKVDYERLAHIARSVGAYFWADIGQNVGLTAAKGIPSPVPFADVVTFSANDSLRGPQTAVILTTKKLAQAMDDTVINTGHVALKNNVLAALAMALKEATDEKFFSYAKQVLQNAKALQKGIVEGGLKVMCGGTDTHLVLMHLSDILDARVPTAVLSRAGIEVKADEIVTFDEDCRFNALRLSALNPTTRSFKEEDMETVGNIIAELFLSPLDTKDIENAHRRVRELVGDKPLFADEWIVEDSDED